MSLLLYELGQKAKDDLEGIWEYTMLNWSEKQAERYVRGILEVVKLLSEHRTTGRKVDYYRSGYWMKQASSHLIFYRFSEKLEVIRILHKRMDIGRHV